MFQFTNAFRKNFTIHGPKPKDLSITRDESGVPHISANNTDDLNWGLGYCHATDRSSQLLMMRILGKGRLCELLEDSEDNLAIDLFFRRVNWKDHLSEQVAKLDEATRSWCQSYCDGINAGLRARQLFIFRMLGYTPEPWTIADTMLISRMAGYLTLAQSQGEIERVFLEMVQGGISTEKLAELFPIDTDSFDRELIEKINLNERIVPNEKLWEKSIPRMMASNNWVVSGSKSKSGSTIMANDPHLEVNRLPNVWYEVSVLSPNYRACGFNMPGLPGVLVGRTPDIAWGATYTFMDTVDSWVEQCQKGKYKRGKRWLKFDAREEVIKRKKHADYAYTFYENKHGVLDGDPNQEAYLLTTNWSPALSGAESLIASYEMTLARDTKSAMSILGKIESAFNWVVSDSEGNIGYQMSGLMPKRDETWNGFTPAPGWDSKFDWQGFHKISDLPSAYNPDCGYIVTANQDLNHLSKTLNPINMPMGDYRAKRIAHLLDASANHTVSSMGKIQMDTYSQQAELFLEVLLPLLEKQSLLCESGKILKNWDQNYKVDSVGASLFEVFYAELRKVVFSPNEFGDKALEYLADQTGVFIDFYQNFDRCLLNEKSAWYEHTSRDEAFLKAFSQAKTKFTKTTWGECNQFVFTNQLFQGKLPPALGFDTQSFPLAGGRATPHQGQIYQSAGRQTSFAPSIRLVADMSEPVLHTAIAGGVSDQRLSPWYKSGIQGWLEGRFKTLK